MSLSDETNSPWHVLLRYCMLTQQRAPLGSELLRALKPPYAPLSADRVGSLRDEALHTVGVPKCYTAKSTRGAFVSMLAGFGLSAEVVARIGQWPSLDVMRRHYLRLKAALRVAVELDHRFASPV